MAGDEVDVLIANVDGTGQETGADKVRGERSIDRSREKTGAAPDFIDNRRTLETQNPTIFVVFWESGTRDSGASHQ